MGWRTRPRGEREMADSLFTKLVLGRVEGVCHVNAKIKTRRRLIQRENRPHIWISYLSKKRRVRPEISKRRAAIPYAERKGCSCQTDQRNWSPSLSHRQGFFSCLLNQDSEMFKRKKCATRRKNPRWCTSVSLHFPVCQPAAMKLAEIVYWLF